MRKSTQAISLVLIGSTSLFFYGCESRQQACNQVGPNGQPSKDCSGSGRVAHGGYYGRTGSGSTTGTDTSTGTKTGGFGSRSSGFSGSSSS